MMPLAYADFFFMLSLFFVSLLLFAICYDEAIFAATPSAATPAFLSDAAAPLLILLPRFSLPMPLRRQLSC